MQPIQHTARYLVQRARVSCGPFTLRAFPCATFCDSGEISEIAVFRQLGMLNNCWRHEQAGLSCAMDSNPNRRLENEILSLWLAPIVATLPLIPFFTLRFSPLFLGALMADRGPTTWPWIGPVVSAAGVVFDGTILGY